MKLIKPFQLLQVLHYLNILINEVDFNFEEHLLFRTLTSAEQLL